MGANKLVLPARKVLVANLEETSTFLTAIHQASTGRTPGIRIPATISSSMKTFPKVLAWFEKNTKAYETLLTASAGNAPATRTKGAAG